MDLDKIAELIRETDGITNAEVVTYTNENGILTKQTVSFRFYSDGDYQWNITSKPI